LTDDSAPDRQRIDKWLWHARVVKTRTLAQKLVVGGKVRVNGDKVLAANTLVKTGDVATVVVQTRVRVLKIIGFSQRRGGAPAAQALYEDLTPPTVPDDRPGMAVHPGGLAAGRPGKRDRRKLAELKNFDNS